MTGKNLLYNCPKSIKDIIIKVFGSLDKFYAFVIQLSYEQYIKFKQTGQYDNSKFEVLKTHLESLGSDYDTIDSIIFEISNDFSEELANKIVQQELGPTWKAQIEAFERMIQ